MQHVAAIPRGAGVVVLVPEPSLNAQPVLEHDGSPPRTPRPGGSPTRRVPSAEATRAGAGARVRHQRDERRVGRPRGGVGTDDAPRARPPLAGGAADRDSAPPARSRRAAPAARAARACSARRASARRARYIVVPPPPGRRTFGSASAATAMSRAAAETRRVRVRVAALVASRGASRRPPEPNRRRTSDPRRARAAW